MKQISKIEIVFAVIVFFVMFLFFTGAHALVPYDGDDWLCFSVWRTTMLPEWGGWNPVKVLPESFQPLCGLFGAYVLQPILGDYVRALIVSVAGMISLFITLYILMIFRFLSQKFHLLSYQAIWISLITFFLHFLILKVGNGYNNHLFYAGSVVSYFNNFLPAIMCMIMLIYLEINEVSADYREHSEDIFVNGLVYFCLYLAICSSVLNNIVLVGWVIAGIALNLFQSIKQKKISIKDFVASHSFWLGIIILWLVVLLFEANGGRADCIGKEALVIKDVLRELKVFAKNYMKNLLLWGTIALTLIVLAFKINQGNHTTEVNYYHLLLKRATVSLAIWGIYIMLVTGKAGAGYAVRIDVLWGAFFYILLVVISALALIVKRCSRIWYAVPVLVLCMLFRVVDYQEEAFQMASVGCASPASCEAVTRDLIHQFILNDYGRHKKMKLYVPKGVLEDNWPHPFYFGRRMAKTLFLHNVISFIPDEVEIIPNQDMNYQYHIPFKQ